MTDGPTYHGLMQSYQTRSAMLLRHVSQLDKTIRDLDRLSIANGDGGAGIGRAGIAVVEKQFSHALDLIDGIEKEIEYYVGEYVKRHEPE